MAYHKKRVGEVDDDRLKFEISTVIVLNVTYSCRSEYTDTVCVTYSTNL